MKSKVINQILEVASGTDYPVILIINHTYAYPEIMMGFGEDVSGRISGIIHYRNGTSEYHPPNLVIAEADCTQGFVPAPATPVPGTDR